MLPVLEGIIARRILLNYRVDPAVAQRNLPEPLKVEVREGAAIAGICLIRLEQLRPKHMPAFVGLSSENMAHRIAVLYPDDSGWRSGVFIWRRGTDQRLVQALGGRAFPGVHHLAHFNVTDSESSISMEVTSDDGHFDLRFSALQRPWQVTRSFTMLQDASDFFAKGECGFSCNLAGDHLEGMRLKTIDWRVDALQPEFVESKFFSDLERFPAGSVEFDCGLLMRGIRHEWHELQDVPELATVQI